MTIVSRMQRASACVLLILTMAIEAHAATLPAGFSEALVASEAGPFCFGDKPTLADLCLVPQLGNARRFGVDVSAFPRLLKAEAAAREMKAFADAAPDKQADAE